MPRKRKQIFAQWVLNKRSYKTVLLAHSYHDNQDMKATALLAAAAFTEADDPSRQQR